VLSCELVEAREITERKKQNQNFNLCIDSGEFTCSKFYYLFTPWRTVIYGEKDGLSRAFIALIRFEIRYYWHSSYKNRSHEPLV
jgi:hypothetical protein